MARDFIPRREPETPSNTIAYFFREAVRRIWVSKRTSFVAIGMIAISLLIVGLFLLVADNLARAAEEWQGNSRVIVYLETSATPAQTQSIDSWLAAQPSLAKRTFVTREEALARFQTWFTNLNDVVGQLDANPFPASFEIDIDPRLAQQRTFHQQMASLGQLAGVDQVQYDWEWVTRLRKVVYVINLAGLIAGGVLAIAAAFTIANVIRLTMMLYREEIEIMRLVGATERIIRGPFVIEGILQGTLGGLLALGLLWASWEAARRSIAPSASLLWGFLFTGFLPWTKAAALVFGGTLAGWIGSWLTVRERT